MSKNMSMGMGSLMGRPPMGRKFRWSFSGKFGKGIIEERFVKVVTRPQLIEETELDFISAKTWIPSKPAPKGTVTVNMYELSGEESLKLEPLYLQMAAWYNVNQAEVTDEERFGEVTLKLYDGCGTLMESWELPEVRPLNINFGELDFSTSDSLDLEITFEHGAPKYTNHCPPIGKKMEFFSSVGTSFVMKDDHAPSQKIPEAFKIALNADLRAKEGEEECKPIVPMPPIYGFKSPHKDRWTFNDGDPKAERKGYLVGKEEIDNLPSWGVTDECKAALEKIEKIEIPQTPDLDFKFSEIPNSISTEGFPPIIFTCQSTESLLSNKNTDEIPEVKDLRPCISKVTCNYELKY